MVSRRSHWRSVEEWNKLSVPLATASSEASKMFDASLTQIVAFYDEDSVGGLTGSMKTMLEADPEFVMGQCLSLNLQLFSNRVTLQTTPDLQHTLQQLQQQLQKQPQLSSGERRHVKAVQLMAQGDMEGACETWEDILVDHPQDLMALKMAYLGYIYLGHSRQIRDTVARVLPHWAPSTPLYSFLVGMHAFGLEETNLYDQAEKQATKALEVNEHDAWATHTLSHVFEMTGQQSRGIHFLDSTVNHWNKCGMLACHNWWHLALHHIELGNFEGAMEIFEKQVKSRCLKQGDMFNITDSASLLFRLEMEGVKTEDLWQELREVCQPYLEKRMSVFNDTHLFMAFLGARDHDAIDNMLASLERFVSEGQGTARDVHQRVGLHICRALAAYRQGDFAQAVSIMYPLRYQVYTIGGSHAQRDVFNLFLIVSALQSPDRHHHKLARTLLAERKALKENSPLTDRLVARAKSLEVE